MNVNQTPKFSIMLRFVALLTFALLTQNMMTACGSKITSSDDAPGDGGSGSSCSSFLFSFSSDCEEETNDDLAIEGEVNNQPINLNSDNAVISLEIEDVNENNETDSGDNLYLFISNRSSYAIGEQSISYISLNLQLGNSYDLSNITTGTTYSLNAGELGSSIIIREEGSSNTIYYITNGQIQFDTFYSPESNEYSQGTFEVQLDDGNTLTGFFSAISEYISGDGAIY